MSRCLSALGLAALFLGTPLIAPGQIVLRKQIRGRVAAQPDVPPPDPKVTDAKALEAAGLKADDADALLTYFRQRTLSDSDLGRIQAVIRRFNEDDFDERLKAAAEAERFGPAAVGPLRTAAEAEGDPETAYRAAETLKRLEKVPHASVALAAVRALAESKPAAAAGVLLGFLPLADDDAVADEIRKTLVAMAVRDGAAEPALVAALTDSVAVRRAAAGVALIEGGPAGSRVHIPDAYPKVREAARVEKDADTRFQLVYSLLTVSREKEAVGALIDLLPDLPRGRLWQAEDYLLQLAGKDAPKAQFGRSWESVTAARDAWAGWWTAAAPATDLAAFRYEPRITGRTLIVLMDLRFGNPGAVVELGPDMKERWKIPGLSLPMDAQMLPDGTVAIAEQGGSRVTIRNTQGRVVSTRTVGGRNRVHGEPQQIQVLPDGNLLVVCRNTIVEYKKDADEEVMRYVRNQHDIAAARRLPDGSTAVMLVNGPNYCLFLDGKGFEQADRKLKTGMPYYQGGMDVPGKDRLLVTEMSQVVEYDLTTNKSVWKKQANQARSVQRLPNGNTLLVESGGTLSGRMVEVTPDGEEVWTFQPSGKLGGLTVSRAYRQ